MDALLLSGGVDSIALAAWKRPALAITVDYGQVCAAAEFRAAGAACAALGIPHVRVAADCRSLGSGDLAGKPAAAVAPEREWWPYRNQLLVTLAAAEAVTRGVRTLMLGTVRSDSFHADGTPEFVRLTDELLRYQEGGLRLEAPAIELTTAELVRRSGADLPLLCWAHSCHTADWACGRCRGCAKHRDVMAELGHDPF